jgi:hypothetical protein
MALKPIKIVYLNSDQIEHIKSLVEMRLSELTIVGENPIIINFYADILIQLRMGK